MSSATIPHQTQSAVERYFEVSLYLLILTGFATLASTGRLDVISLAGVGTALAYRGYQIARRQELVLSVQWTTYLTLAYGAFYLFDFFLLSRSFVSASVHLVLFSMVVKLFSVQRDRDLLYLAVLSLLMVLAAAVLTVDTAFLAAFAVFLMLAVTTFISLEMRRAARRTGMMAREHAQARRVGRALSATAVMLVGAILLAGAMIFFVLPRISANYLSQFAPRNVLATGFTNEVNLGDIGEIQQSSAMVMHVHVEGDAGGTHPDLYWRGVALTTFDGQKWTSPIPHPDILRARDGIFDLRGVTTRAAPPTQLTQPIHYRVMMEPTGMSVFFLAGVPQLLYGRYSAVGIDRGSMAVFNAGREPSITTYEVMAEDAHVISAGGATPAAIGSKYLQLPEVDPRVRALAAQVTAPATSDLEKAQRLEAHLRTQYRYTLELPNTVAPDPIARFLFQRKAGHCEYFASSMAIMLRTLGIPSRVVNGFHGGEFNSVTGSYIVRARDAHSWVEAYFPDAGWVRFDPTPASPEPVATGLGRFFLYLDAAREFWREWIIDYDFLHQTQVSNSVLIQGRSLFEGWRRGLRRRYQELLASARRVQDQAAQAPEKWSSTGAGAVLALLLLLNARKILAAIRSTRLAHAPGRAPKKAASIWYERMAHSVARRGYAKAPEQTPYEFVVTIEDPHLRQRVEAFTRAYERARFADSPEDARRLPELFEQVKSAR